jgi:hypothetical protein
MFSAAAEESQRRNNASGTNIRNGRERMMA